MKAGRPKHKKPGAIPLILPLDGLRYRAERAYWHMRLLEDKIMRDALSVKQKDYQAAVDLFVELAEEMKKKGYERQGNGKAKKRIQSSGLAENGRHDSAPAVGGERQAGVGAGVPAPNPLT